MAGDKPGPESRVPRALWAELQALERAGRTQQELVAWLAERGVELSRPALSRTLARIREAAGEPPPDDPELEPASDEDELRLMRRKFRADYRNKALSARDQQGAARLLLQIMEAQRPKTVQPPAGVGQTAAVQERPAAPAPAPALTPEQEAEAVRAQLGKRALA